MIWNLKRFPFHFNSFERIKETKWNTLFFGCVCRKKSGLPASNIVESTIVMCINALEIVHALTGINGAGVRWCLATQNVEIFPLFCFQQCAPPIIKVGYVEWLIDRPVLYTDDCCYCCCCRCQYYCYYYYRCSFLLLFCLCPPPPPQQLVDPLFSLSLVLSSLFSNKKWNASYMNWWRKIVRVFECDSFKPDIGHLATHYLMDWSLFVSATFDNIKCHRKYTERTLNMNPILHGLFLFALLLLLLFFSRCCWNFRSTIVPCSLAFSLFIYINVPKVFWFFMDNRCTFISRYSQWNAFKYLLCVRLLLLLFYH